MATIKTKKDKAPKKAEPKYKPYPLAAPVTGDEDINAFAQSWIESADWHECEANPKHAEAAITDRKFWSYYKKPVFKEAMREVGYRVQKRGKDWYIIAADEDDNPIKLKGGRSASAKEEAPATPAAASEAPAAAEAPKGDYSADAKLRATVDLFLADEEASLGQAVEAVNKIIKLLEGGDDE